jgi:HK97 family phage portal protein
VTHLTLGPEFAVIAREDHESVKSWLAQAERGDPAALKTLSRMVFSGYGGGLWGADVGGYNGYLGYGMLGLGPPGAKHDYVREAGDLWRNSAVAVCLGWLQDNFPSARLQVCRVREDQPDEPIPGHPLVQLLRRPNPSYSARALWAATVLSYKVDGNAYWIKARGSGGYGQPLELWYEPHWNIYPNWDIGGRNFITGYVLRRSGTAPTLLKPSDVVHFRDGLDPYNPRLGLSRLKMVIRNVAGMNAAESYTAAILRNMGVPPVLFMPEDGDVELDEPTEIKLREKYQEQTSGENAGRAFGVNFRVHMERLGLSPEDLALGQILDRPEATICAALGVPPMVVGLAVGTKQRTYSNLKEADSQAWNNGLVPMQDALAEDGLYTQLLPDFGPTDGLVVKWDRSRVAALQEDRGELARTATAIYQGGYATKNEAREVMGLPPVEGGDDDWFPGGRVSPAAPGASDSEPGEGGGPPSDGETPPEPTEAEEAGR